MTLEEARQAYRFVDSEPEDNAQHTQSCPAVVPTPCKGLLTTQLSCGLTMAIKPSKAEVVHSSTRSLSPFICDSVLVSLLSSILAVLVISPLILPHTQLLAVRAAVSSELGRRLDERAQQARS